MFIIIAFVLATIAIFFSVGAFAWTANASWLAPVLLWVLLALWELHGEGMIQAFLNLAGFSFTLGFALTEFKIVRPFRRFFR